MKYTDEYLLQSIVNKANELHKTPAKRELPHYQAIVARFGSYTNALEKCGLKPNKKNVKDIGEYIDIIHNFVEREKRVPTQDDFYNDKSLPDPTIVRKRFGLTWNTILRKAGYEPNMQKAKTHKLTTEQTIEIFKSEYSKMKDVTIHGYDKQRTKGTPSWSFITRKTGLTWNELLESIGVDKINYAKYEKDDLIDIICKLYTDLGQVPSITDLERSGHAKTAFIKIFGSWPGALQAAGLSPLRFSPANVSESNTELIQLYRSFSKTIGKDKYGASTLDLKSSQDIYNDDIFYIRFGGMNELRKLAGFEIPKHHKKKYEKEDVAILLRKLCKKLGRRPTNKEINQNVHLPAVKTICALFHTTRMSDVWWEVS